MGNTVEHKIRERITAQKKKARKRLKRARAFLYKALVRLRKQNPVFIVGCGHSGTTLMLRVMAHHKDMYGVSYESNAFLRQIPKVDEFVKWDQEVSINQLNRWVEKTPGHVRELDKIFEYFPDSRVIVLVRDGRDVALSIKNRNGTIEEAIKRWLCDNNAWLAYEDDERVKMIRLEDLSNDPAQQISRVCSHLNEEFYPELMNYHLQEFTYENAGIEKSDGRGERHQKNRNWQVNQPIFKSTQRWEKEATDLEKRLFSQDEELVNMLERFGYTQTV